MCRENLSFELKVGLKAAPLLVKFHTVIKAFLLSGSPSKGNFHSTGDLEMKINHLTSSVNRTEMEEINWQ